MQSNRGPGGSGVSKSLLCILFCLVFQVLSAQEYPPVEADIWIELDSAAGDLDPVAFTEARKLADAEARFLLSGMVYGYTFSYRPLDRERGIGEEFILEPTSLIPREALVPVDVRGRGSRAMLLYRLLSRPGRVPQDQRLAQCCHPQRYGLWRRTGGSGA